MRVTEAERSAYLIDLLNTKHKIKELVLILISNLIYGYDEILYKLQ